jgi:molecular chaperone DnaK
MSSASAIQRDKKSLPIGIDLGTTYSVVAYLDDTGRPVTIVNAEGDLLTPSAVLFDGDNTVVGKEAIKAVSSEADHVAECAKRDLGERSYHRVIDGRRYPPEAIEAWVLYKVRSDAERQLGKISRVVITVPAYFDETRRKATQDAGYMAGLEVLDIINEPTAAAVAFGFQQGFLNAEGSTEKPQKILVYDLGGGTFDVTIMEISGTKFTALGTDGDVRLGGRDFDQRIVDYVAEEFLRQHKLDPRDDANAAGRLWRECEDAKRTLSARAKAGITFDFKGNSVRTEITREKFEEITFDLIDRTRFTTKQTLQAARCTWENIDRVLLVGGSSRMPMVRKMIKDLSGKDPDVSVSADEAVAHGAALHAGILLARNQGNRVPFKIKNVNSHSLGVVATDRKTGRKRNATLIPRNTALPVTAKRVFKTSHAGQKSILVQIVEGESASPDDCSQLGKCVVRDLPPELPADTSIEVLFRYADNGRLTIQVKVVGTDKELEHEINRENSMTPEQLETWRQYISGAAAHPEAAQST